MLTFQEAQEEIIKLAGSFGTEVVLLEMSLGRTLAEPIFADQDYPPFNRATMDGYAMHFADITAGILEFIIVETIFAGQVSNLRLATAQCYKIMTGASVPSTADIVIQREIVVEQNNTITIRRDHYKAYQNISKKGEDIASGACVINPHLIITPAAISAMAAVGKMMVIVEKLPKVALFTTGNEIVDIDKPVSFGQIRNSNQYLLKALLKNWRIVPFLCNHIKDDKDEISRLFSQGITADIMLVSGGVSAGDADFVPEILESLGVKKLFHKVAIKPGKPIWCGQMPGGAMVFALPGNPFSSLVTFTLFVETYLSYSLGAGNPGTLELPFHGNRVKKSNVVEFFPVSVREFPLSAFPLSFNGSGDILAALAADGIAQHPADTASLTPGAPITVRMFKK
jgi:molybdopterin molybdotransferase